MSKIRIETQKGRMIERQAQITDWMGNDGRQFATATIGRAQYSIVKRDVYGPIWAVSR